MNKSSLASAGSLALSDRDRAIAALTIYGEATPGNDLDRLGVACVILNRAANPRPAQWGEGVAGVCLHRVGRWGQFSCWNLGGDGLRPKLLPFLRSGDLNAAQLEAWAEARLAPFIDAFERAVAGERPVPGFGASHYARADWIASGRVNWSRRLDRAQARLGAHAYFRPEDLDRPEAPITPYAPVIAPQPVPRPADLARPSAPYGRGGFWARIATLIARIFGGR